MARHIDAFPRCEVAEEILRATGVVLLNSSALDVSSEAFALTFA